MSNLFQVLFMMAVPAAFLLTCRYFNLRDYRAPSAPKTGVDAVTVSRSDTVD
jgi:hypothetical protein